MAWMVLLWIALATVPSAAFDHTYGSYAELLSTHVCNGAVDYVGIGSRKNLLAVIAGEFESVSLKEFRRFSEKEQITFLINGYNFYTIQLIVRHLPLTTGIRDISKPWGTPFIPLFGKLVSLDHVEHDLLRKKYREPRIHFGLVCAAKGCPVLPAAPFVPFRLDSMLDGAARHFFADTTKNVARGDTVAVSQIFEWFGSDFDTMRGGLRGYVAVMMGVRREDFTLRFREYDWRLNIGGRCP